MLISMFAWVLRFGLFAYGNPGDGLWMIIMSCVVYGMAFDFFNISGSLFVKLLPTLEYVLAHRVVYDDVKRIWGFLWWDFQRNSY
jgi:predicted branched-subunit amino acid permease